MHGLLWLVRYKILNEDIPDFLDYTKVFKIPTYRKKYKVANVEGPDFHQQWKRFFDACGANVSKVTHQPRKQGQMELYDANVEISKIAHMAGYAPAGNSESVKQQRSYLTNPPVTCIVQRAGGDPMNTKGHWAGWSTVIVPDEMIMELLPGLMEKKRVVLEQYEKAGSIAKKAEGRLFTMRGTLLSFIHDIKQALRMLASRIVCPTTYRMDPAYDECVRDMYHRKRLYMVLDQDVFKGDLFMKLKRDVYEAQLRWEGVLSSPEESIIQNTTASMIKDDIDPKFDKLQRSVDAF